MAPVVKTLAGDDRFDCCLVVTAQHREMLDQVLASFSLVPDYDLNIMQERQSLTDITVHALKGLEKVMTDQKPDLVLVHGDTTTTFAASLAAFYCQVPVGHVEAGLRSDDIYNPFPEEMNRRLTDTVASIYFAPTDHARSRLVAEGANERDIFVTGNTVIDALLQTVTDGYTFQPPVSDVVGEGGRLIVVTTHRRENLGDPMRHVYRALAGITRMFPDVHVVFPLHLNPAVREIARAELSGVERIHMIEPPAYDAFANLLARCDLVLTDSGGIQEEAPALNKPVLVLRNTTERPEGVQAGTLKLTGTDTNAIVTAVRNLLMDEEEYRKMAEARNPYGDGHACERIRDIVAHYFNLISSRPADFHLD